MLQCVLTGRAQEPYSAICAEYDFDYEALKLAVLKAYKLVWETYCQKLKIGGKAINKPGVRP